MDTVTMGGRAATSPEGDVVHKLGAHHARVRSLFEEIRMASGEQRQQAFEELRGWAAS